MSLNRAQTDQVSDSNHDVVRVPPRPRHDADMEIARRPDAPVDTGAQIPLRRDGGRPQALGHAAVRRRSRRCRLVEAEGCPEGLREVLPARGHRDVQRWNGEGKG